MNLPKRNFSLLAGLAISVVMLTGTSFAQQNAIGFDAYRFQTQGGGAYFDLTATPNQFDSIDITLPAGSTQGGGTYVGVPNLTMDPADYQLEFKFKLNAGHVADTVNIVARQNDGTVGVTAGEDFQWYFTDLNNRFNTGTPDADGYVTLIRDVTELPNPFNGSTTEPWDGRYQAFGKDVDGDMLFDTNVVQGSEPNGILEMQVQASGDDVNGWDAIDMTVKSVRFVQKNPGNVVATFDNSGVNGTWGSVQAAGAFQRDDTTALTNVIIDADVDANTGFASGGAWLNTIPSETTFNADDYRIELTAKLLPNNTATEMGVILKDLDGYDGSDPALTPASGEEHGYNFDITQLNSSTMTTISMPANTPTWTNARGFNFTSDGDGDLTDFNLYEFQIGPLWESFDRLNIEIEKVQIVANAVATDCDFDGDGDCDIADIDALYQNWGVLGGAFDLDGSGTVETNDIVEWLTQASSPSNPFNANGKTFVLGDLDFDGDVDSTDLGALLNNFNDASGLGYTSGNLNDDTLVNSSDLGVLLNNFNFTSAAASAVPEPGAMSLVGIACMAMLFVRRRR